MTPQELLDAWLTSRLPGPALNWLQQQADSLRAGGGERALYVAMSLVARKVGKSDLDLTSRELEAAQVARDGWDPTLWSLDQAARVYLLLVSGADGESFSKRLDQLCSTADVGELVALYRGLPLYPDQPRHVLRAAEGVRTNMKAVFLAVAHSNPYPFEQLPEQAWNQMVLKALFVGASLDPIVGLDQRVNPSLARMLRDYAHERWSAGRPVSPELWRCVGPFAEGAVLDDLSRVLRKGSPPEREAAALSLSRSPDPEADALLRGHPELRAALAAGRLSWRALAPPT